MLSAPQQTHVPRSSKPELRYHADFTAGALKVPESRKIADLLIEGCTEEEWRKRIVDDNVLQARSALTAKRLTLLIRKRLETMDLALWRLVRDRSLTVATHACLAAAVKQSALLGDFLDLVVREQYRLRAPTLSRVLWERYVEDCRNRDPDLPAWKQSTVDRLRSSVFQILAQAGYIENTKTLTLQRTHIARDVLQYLEARDEHYVLRCITVHP
ncbi:MAG: DUF1819 family protein [Rhodothermales bacterium]|nr:DUF1819 family protein [Rhodothermales bacterium]